MQVLVTPDSEGRGRAVLAGELTIVHLAAARAELESQRGDAPLALDLSGVERIDSAGLQFLLALAGRGRGPVCIAACSQAVQNLIDLYRVSDLLALADRPEH